MSEQFYCYRRCSTCARARQWLREHDVVVPERDVILDPMTPADIEQLAQAAGGVAVLLSKRSPAYKKYHGTVKTDAAWILAMAEEPRLIRRPIWQVHGQWLVGFDPQAWQAALNSRPLV